MRVLFVKLGAIGDVTQAAAAMLHFRARHPGAEITWVVGKAIAPLLNRFGVADHVHALDESRFFPAPCPLACALARHALALRGLSSRFDLVVTAYGDWRYRLLTGLVRASRFRYYDRRAIRRPSPLQHRNRVFEYIRLLEDEGERHADISALMQALGERFLAHRSADVPPMATVSKHVVLAPGAHATCCVRMLCVDGPWTIT
jgi:ADP-heptose:LPS heptosyltransferase